VPVSTQWGAQGYFYPIQIAQYGLSHYSKHVIKEKKTEEGESVRGEEVEVVCDAHLENSVDKWTTREQGWVERVRDTQLEGYVIQFKALG